jgi:hypothetical protein
MGVAASQMEKKGIKTDRGNINRQAEFKSNTEPYRRSVLLSFCFPPVMIFSAMV